MSSFQVRAVRLSALPTGTTSTGCNSSKLRSTRAFRRPARRRGGRGGGAENPPPRGRRIIPARSSFANATRQLISFQWPLGERQSNHAHTRRDSAVRDNPGSRSSCPLQPLHQRRAELLSANLHRGSLQNPYPPCPAKNVGHAQPTERSTQSPPIRQRQRWGEKRSFFAPFWMMD